MATLNTNEPAHLAKREKQRAKVWKEGDQAQMLWILGYEALKRIARELKQSSKSENVNDLMTIAECELHLGRGQEEYALQQVRRAIVTPHLNSPRDIRDMGYHCQEDGHYGRAMILYKTSHDLFKNLKYQPDEKIKWLKNRVVDIQFAVKPMMDGRFRSKAPAYAFRLMTELLNELIDVKSDNKELLVLSEACSLVAITFVANELKYFELSVNYANMGISILEFHFKQQASDHKYYGWLTNNLGFACESLMQYVKAESFYIKSIDAKKRSLEYEIESEKNSDVEMTEESLTFTRLLLSKQSISDVLQRHNVEEYSEKNEIKPSEVKEKCKKEGQLSYNDFAKQPFPSKTVWAVLDGQGGIIKVDDCSVSFPPGSFDSAQTVVVTAEINSQKWPAEKTVVTPSLSIKAKNLKKAACIILSTWCTNNITDREDHIVQVMEYSNRRQDWSIVHACRLQNSMKIEFFCEHFCRYVGVLQYLTNIFPGKVVVKPRLFISDRWQIFIVAMMKSRLEIDTHREYLERAYQSTVRTVLCNDCFCQENDRIACSLSCGNNPFRFDPKIPIFLVRNIIRSSQTPFHSCKLIADQPRMTVIIDLNISRNDECEHVQSIPHQWQPDAERDQEERGENNQQTIYNITAHNVAAGQGQLTSNDSGNVSSMHASQNNQPK